MASSRASPPTRKQMSALCSKIPAIVVERIEASHPARAHFLMTELEGWPEGALSKLARCGLLQVSDHAEAIVCPGCDWQCHKRISARKTFRRAGARLHCLRRGASPRRDLRQRSRTGAIPHESVGSSKVGRRPAGKGARRKRRPAARHSYSAPSMAGMALARCALPWTAGGSGCGSASTACPWSRS